MDSLIAIRNVYIEGRRTTVSLEDAFWNGLEEVAKSRCMTRLDLVEEINKARKHVNLSSALRLFVLNHYQERAKAAPPLALH